MPGVTRVLQDSAGGVNIGPGAPTVVTEGKTTSVINDKQAPHGQAPHVTATLVSSSSTVYAEGKLVTRDGDSASCGHTTNGSGTVFAG